MSQLPPLQPVDAFPHVIYDHRYLAVAGSAWRFLGHASEGLDRLIPELGPLVQDSFLLHARSLIDFYAKDGAGPTDIVLRSFGLAVSDTTREALLEFKNPIEVHLLHLTAWRDTDYRRTHQATDLGLTRQRPDWNAENARLVETILGALREVASAGKAWSPAFERLHAACARRVDDRAYSWPPELGEKSDVARYLSGLGLH